MKKHITALFLFMIAVSTAGCTIPPFLSGKTSTQTSCSKQIAHHEKKWIFVGKISKKHPNPMRVLMIQTQNMGAALHIMKENSEKYSTTYFRSLALGTSIYISKNNELFINKEGGAAPDETVTTYTTIDNCKKKPRLRYVPPENRNINISEIKEEDLTE